MLNISSAYERKDNFISNLFLLLENIFWQIKLRDKKINGIFCSLELLFSASSCLAVLTWFSVNQLFGYLDIPSLENSYSGQVAWRAGSDPGQSRSISRPLPICRPLTPPLTPRPLPSPLGFRHCPPHASVACLLSSALVSDGPAVHPGSAPGCSLVSGPNRGGQKEEVTRLVGD